MKKIALYVLTNDSLERKSAIVPLDMFENLKKLGEGDLKQFQERVIIEGLPEDLSIFISAPIPPKFVFYLL